MSKPVLEDLFAFSGRRNRKSYFLYFLVLTVVAVVVNMLFLDAESIRYNGFGGSAVFGFLIFIPLAVSGWAVSAQRCRDFGWTGWSVLLTLIPFVGFIFAIAIMFIPGTQGDNRYGPDPIGSLDGSKNVDLAAS